MKKALEILCICCLFAASAPIPAAAAAGGGWYRVTDDGVGFYPQPSDASDALFTLEKTYYIYASAETGGYLEVSLFDNTGGFARISGYVKAADVEESLTPAEPVYPTETLTVTAGTVLKSGADPSSADIAAVVSGRTAYYYGEAPSGGWYYVRYDNAFGYISAGCVSAPDIAPHPTPIAPEPEPEPPANDDQQTAAPADTSTGEIILIVLICVPAVVIVLLLFMPQKNGGKKPRPPRPKYMSDNDTFDDLDLL